MPVFEYACTRCGASVDKIRKSYEAALESPEVCVQCNFAPMTLVEVVRVSFQSFKPFTTQAFNSRPGAAPIEVTDRAQLRRLLKTHGMVEQGDSSNYFGSNPNSTPTWAEIRKHGKPKADPNSAKKVKVVDSKEWEKHADFVTRTDYGRRESGFKPEEIPHARR